MDLEDYLGLVLVIYFLITPMFLAWLSLSSIYRLVYYLL